MTQSMNLEVVDTEENLVVYPRYSRDAEHPSLVE